MENERLKRELALATAQLEAAHLNKGSAKCDDISAPLVPMGITGENQALLGVLEQRRQAMLSLSDSLRDSQLELIAEKKAIAKERSELAQLRMALMGETAP